MPDLPTLTVSDAQQTRILAAMKDYFGTTTNSETVTAYKVWLSTQLKDIVFRYESRTLNEQRDQLRENINATAIDPVV